MELYIKQSARCVCKVNMLRVAWRLPIDQNRSIGTGVEHVNLVHIKTQGIPPVEF